MPCGVSMAGPLHSPGFRRGPVLAMTRSAPVRSTAGKAGMVQPAYPAHGSLALFSNGTVKYSPHIGFTGVDMFVYAITDGEGIASAVVKVTVLPQ